MSLQRIVNVCETLNIDRRKVVGVQYTRSEVAKVSETPTRNPWRFNLTIAAALIYSQNRDLLEQIDYLDRRYPEVLSFSTSTGASAGLAYMFAYQGAIKTYIPLITVTSFVGNQLTLNVANVSIPNVGGSTAVVFKKGDLIQIKNYPYPFTSTTDVLRGSADTITVTTHRPNFIGTGVNGLGINVGNDCQFKMFCPNMPTYKLSPGGPNAIIQWTSDFQLYEWTGDIL
jgi:uncharacterized membrane protein